MGLNNKGDFLASVTGISRDGAGFRNGMNQQLSDIIKDRGSYCPSLCPSPEYQLHPQTSFPSGGGIAASHSWGFMLPHSLPMRGEWGGLPWCSK